MWPEGDPKSATVQEVLYWQSQTMEMMYQVIARELKSMQLVDSHPLDYLNFYCLGNREANPQSSNGTDKVSDSFKFQRFMIYVHAKGMIVDDEYVIVGSANINQRSLAGSKDTEIAMGAYQPHHSWAKKQQHPRGQADSPRKRYSRSPSPWEEKSRSRSRSRSRSPPGSYSRPRGRSTSRTRSRSRGREEEVSNPGNTLYVTGLSTRVTERDLEDHFAKQGKVKSVFLVVEPRSRISRGFAFVTMDNLEDANRCIKHLNQSILEGRYITVEKSRRKRGRTPTPGHYLGLKNARGDGGYRGDRGDRGRYRGREDYGYRRSPRHSPYRGRDYSPRRSPYGGRSRRERSYSPYERGYPRGR